MNEVRTFIVSSLMLRLSSAFIPTFVFGTVTTFYTYSTSAANPNRRTKSSVSQEQNAQKFLRQIKSNPFQSKEFPTSKFWQGSKPTTPLAQPSVPEYSAWAAKEAQEVAVITVNLTRSSKPIRTRLKETLNFIARSRQELEMQLQHKYGRPLQGAPYQDYGKDRLENNWSYWSAIELLQGKQANTNTEASRRAILDQNISKPFCEQDLSLYSIPDHISIIQRRACRNLQGYIGTAQSPLSKFIPVWEVLRGTLERNLFYRHNTYIGLNGKETIATRILDFPLVAKNKWPTNYSTNISAGLFLLFSMVEDKNIMLEDALARLEHITQSQRLDTSVYAHSDSNLREFTLAMYAYYNAMPYIHGSAAIGRSFFAGLFYGFFGIKPPQLPDGIDLYAMTALNQEAFVHEIVPILSSVFHSTVQPKSG